MVTSQGESGPLSWPSALQTPQGARFDLIWEKIHNKVFILFFSWEKNAQLTQKCFSFSIVDTVVISTSKSMHSAKRVFPYCLFACLFFVL